MPRTPSILPPMRLRTTMSVALIASMALSALPAGAATFNPNLILSDEELRDVHAMSFLEIYRFLDEKGGMNGIYLEAPDFCDKGKPAGYDPLTDSVPMVKGPAQMVYDAAQCYGINPKYVLAVLQKESGIVEAKTPTQNQMDWAAGYALCDGCYKSSPLAQKYKGLARQIDVSAGWMDWYFANASAFQQDPKNKYKLPGITYTISGQQVTPVNLATAALYSYTPHVGDERVGGNRSLFKIWQRWWGPGFTLALPEGSLIRNLGTGAVALVQNGAYRPIASASVLATRFASANIIDMSESDFDAFYGQRPGKPVKFPDQALVRTETGETYLLIGDVKRLIPSTDVFRGIGFNPEEVEDVAAADLEEYRVGAPIALNEAYPGGALVQDSVTGGVYYVDGGVKRPIIDRGILLANFPGKSIVRLTPAELEKIPRGEPVRLADGVLVKTPDDPAVFVVAAGLRRRIPSEDVFLGYGYRFSAVVTVSAKALLLHEEGLPLELVPVEPPVDAVPPVAATTTQI
jgi:hypothetical protein